MKYLIQKILSGIHHKELFFSIKEKPYLTRIWTQHLLKKFYQAPALPSELFNFLVL